MPDNLKEYSLSKSINKIVNHMKSDKKNKDSRINLILLKNIGKTTKPDTIKMTPEKVKIALDKII